MTRLAARPITTSGPALAGRARIRVGVIGATGYVGGELVRLLERHPRVRITALHGRGREMDTIGSVHAHLGGTPHVIDAAMPADADVVFLALPHGASSGLIPQIADHGRVAIDMGPDFRLRDPADYPRWYGFEHPAPQLLSRAVYGLPELHRVHLAGLARSSGAVIGSPGCYPTATLLALAPLARAALIDDLVVDAKSGVSGAGREPKPDLTYSEVNENVRAYGIDGHRHVAEIEQELAGLSGEGEAEAAVRARPVDFLPHLVPMTRGILASCHVRPSRPVTQAQVQGLYMDAYADEPFVRVVAGPPSTKQVLGSNACLVHVTADERTGRVLAIAVIDNLVKGAAGQGIQAMNLAFELPETAGLDQLPLAP